MRKSLTLHGVTGAFGVALLTIDDGQNHPVDQSSGFRDTFITVAAIGLVFNASMFVMIIYGKKLRQVSAKRYWALVASRGGGH